VPVNVLPSTGQGPDDSQASTTLVILLGATSLFAVAAFTIRQRRNN
jgi:hypothetical protein